MGLKVCPNNIALTAASTIDTNQDESTISISEAMWPQKFTELYLAIKTTF